MNGERRSFTLLRPVLDNREGQERIKTLILERGSESGDSSLPGGALMVVEVDVIIIRALSSLYHFTSSLLQRARRSRDTSTNITTKSSSDGGRNEVRACMSLVA